VRREREQLVTLTLAVLRGTRSGRHILLDLSASRKIERAAHADRAAIEEARRSDETV